MIFERLRTIQNLNHIYILDEYKLEITVYININMTKSFFNLSLHYVLPILNTNLCNYI